MPEVRHPDEMGGEGAAPRVGIVVLNFRGCDKTLRCLESLQRLRYAAREIVVVDNASGDGSATRLRQAFPGIPLIESQKNLGYAGGNRLGYEHFLSRSVKYAWLLNNDTVVAPDALEHLVAEASSDPNIGAVGSLIVDLRARDSVLAVGGGRVNFWVGRAQHVRDPNDRRALDYVTGASMLVPMAVFEKIGFIDDGYFLYYEDADFCFTLRKHGYRLAAARKSVVFHDESSGVGRISLKLCYYMNRSFVRFTCRHSPVVAVSLLVGTTMRVLKRLLAGRFREAAVTILAVRDGWLERSRKSLSIEEGEDSTAMRWLTAGSGSRRARKADGQGIEDDGGIGREP